MSASEDAVQSYKARRVVRQTGEFFFNTRGVAPHEFRSRRVEGISGKEKSLNVRVLFSAATITRPAVAQSERP
jgi:hypothetical protein